MSDKSIQRSLEQDAQIIKERMPMANKEKAFKANEVAASLKDFMAEKGYSQAKIARLLGVSATKLNQFLNDKYSGNLEDIINKAVNLINSASRRDKRIRNKPYIETTVARKIATLITQTEAFGDDDEGKIGLVVGDGGHGKSHCMRQYAESNKNTIYVELDDAMTPTAIFAEIARAVGIDTAGSLVTVTRRLIEHLVDRHVIIMLDEASSLSVSQLNRLRQIIVIKSRCPLILAGNKHLLSTVMQPTTRRGYESLDQFTSRLVCILDLDKLAGDKDGGLYTVKDIREMYEFGGVRLTGDAVGMLRKICKSPRSGRLRTCSHLITALHLSQSVIEQGYIDAELIDYCVEQLDLPVRTHLPIVTTSASEETEEQQEQQAKAAG